MKIICFLVGCWLAWPVIVRCQTFEVPELNVATLADYDKYDSSIVEAAKWLENTDLNKELDKRAEVIAFVLRWLNGTKQVTVEVNDPIAKLYGGNDPLLGIFLASYSRSSLEHRPLSKFTDTKAAVLSMMKVYKKGIEISKSKEMLRAIKADQEGKLDDYIEHGLGVPKE